MKSIGFFACSNGYGHYKRISEIASFLSNDFDITIYASSFQYDKFGPVKNCTHVQLSLDNIRWDLSLKESKVNFDLYNKSIDEQKDNLLRHDYIVSDNIVGVLKYRPDAIIIGSFFWKDVFLDKFGSNYISDLDSDMLSRFNPLLITNKYAETGTVKDYKNKVQYGFGCKDLPYKQSRVEQVLTLKPSLNYLNSYSNFFDKLKLKTTNDVNKISNIALMCRPGLGIITHCVENHIPLIALYDENDSVEIIELADRIQNLNIGFKQNVNTEFNYDKFSVCKDNSIYRYNQLDKNGYKKIAGFLKSKL